MITTLVDPNNYKTYYDNHDKVNNPFIISLEKDKGKYESSKKILNKLGLNPVKFSAIYGKGLKDTHPTIYNKFKKLNDGEIGCFLSHFSIYYLAALHKNQNQYTMIFEDDIGTDLNKITFQKKFNDILKYNANLVYLGKCAEFCNNIKKIENDIYEGYRPYCMHAYMIKNSYARKLVKNMLQLKRFAHPIDVIIFNWVENNDIVEFHPSLFYQDASYQSNLRNKIKQMANEFECRDQLQLPKRSIKLHIDKIILIVVFVVIYLVAVNA